jgi:AmmeMemoRadiSam system protein B
MGQVRAPAVAGFFYPADASQVLSAVRGFLSVTRPAHDAKPPKALIVPHAGYVYSGPVAASAYARLRPSTGVIRRVVLLGPSHRIALRGLAIPRASAFATPLGTVPLDRAALERVSLLPQVQLLDEAHAQEHSLEVQLPFLQEVLGTFRLVPLVTGEATAAEVAEVLELLWDASDTLIVVSSDLSHYHDYETAKKLDRDTSAAIEALRPEGLHAESACGRVGIRGLLLVAQRRGLAVETLDVRNSGDTAGPRDAVVGYGAYAFA